MDSLRLPGAYILASASPRRKELIRLLGIDPKIEPSTLEEAAQTSDPEQLVKTLSVQKALDIASRHGAGEIVIGADTCVYVPSGEDAAAAGEASESGNAASAQEKGRFRSKDAAAAGEILGKPKTHLEAERMVRLLQGRSHEVYTGVTLVRCAASPDMRTTSAGAPQDALETASADAAQDALTEAARSDVLTFVEKTVVTVAPMSEEEIRLYALLDEPMDKAGAYAVQGAFSRFIARLEGDYFNVMGLPLGRIYQELKRWIDA